MNLFKTFMSLLHADNGSSQARHRQSEFSLPFNPPLNTHILYDHERRLERQGQVQTLRSTEQFIWSATQDGFVLQWVTTAFQFKSAEPIQSLMNGIGIALLNKPVHVAITPDGTISELINLDDWRRQNRDAIAGMGDRVVTLFADQPAQTQAAIAARVAGMLAQIDEQTDAQFVDSQLQGLHLLMCEAGPLPAGEDISLTADLPALIGTGLIRTELKARLELNPARTWARLKLASAADANDAAAASGPIVAAALDAIADPEARCQAELMLSDLPPPEIADELVQLFDLPSGLAIRSDYRRSIRIGGIPPRLETRKYRRQR